MLDDKIIRELHCSGGNLYSPRQRIHTLKLEAVIKRLLSIQRKELKIKKLRQQRFNKQIYDRNRYLLKTCDVFGNKKKPKNIPQKYFGEYDPRNKRTSENYILAYDDVTSKLCIDTLLHNERFYKKLDTANINAESSTITGLSKKDTTMILGIIIASSDVVKSPISKGDRESST
jgi:hypothetical protein